MKLIALWISCPNKRNALKIAKELVKDKFLFFGQIFPVESLYWWQGKITPDKQVVIFGETFQRHLSRIEKIIRKLHEDKVPCWTIFTVTRISPESRRWITKNYAS